jgi:hypothetical protein
MLPTRTAIVLALFLVANGAPAQTLPPAMTHGAGHGPPPSGAGSVPLIPGQAAFGAIQEIVGILDADPGTDWSRVDLDALREHLVDMHEVTLRARTEAAPVEGGLRIRATGAGRTFDAIRRMVPAHAREIDELGGWSAATSPSLDGVELTVTSTDPAEVVKIRGLGFMGFMVRGAHHQPHHLAIARGEHPH